MKRPDQGLVAFSVVSGCLWALIALMLGYRAFDASIWGGILVSPLIGLVTGTASAWFGSRFRRGRVIFSLVSLYAAAAAFGMAVSLYEALIRGIGPGLNLESLIEGALATLWGLTVGGYVVLLWPIAHLNHKLLWTRLE